MSLFDKVKKADEVEQQKDTIYSGSKTLQTDIYPAKIKLAILKESKYGALGLELHLDIDGKDYREDIYLTKRTGETYYTKGDKDFPLPGYTITNDLSLLLDEILIEEQDTEKKTVELYDYKLKDTVPKEVDMITSFLGKNIIVGLSEEEHYKQTQSASGNYVNTDEVITKNTISKIFDEEGFTVQERISGLEEPQFINEWVDAYKGKVVDKKKGNAGSSKTSSNAAKSAKPKGSLFGKKK